MARLPHNQLSQTPRAIKWRAEKAEADAAWMAAQEIGRTATSETDPLQPSNMPIGVFSAASRPEPEPQAYHCENCTGTVVPGDRRCPVCQQLLNWKAVGLNSIP